MMQATPHRTLRAVLLTGVMALAACGPEAGKAKTADDAGATAQPEAPAAQAAAQPAAMASETKTFRDWFAVCDNGNDCMAFGPAAENGTGWVRVHMPPGPDARPDVMAGFWPDDGEFGKSPVRVQIDGRSFATAPFQDGDQDAVLSDPAAAVAALVAGRSMTLGLGSETQAMNLNGATAALLWIDERQGRLDTVTALVRRGAKPATAVPPAPRLPLVAPAPEMPRDQIGEIGPTLPATIEAMAEAKACRADTAHFEGIQKEVQSARLDASTELWGMPCYVGAYNTGTRYFLTGPGGARPRVLSFRGTGEAEDILTNAEYSPHTRTIGQFAKGRGLGDCGVASTWTWTGRAFVLSEESVMGECWGANADRWPTTWRSRRE